MVEQPKKNNTSLYITIGAVVLLCCCCLAVIVLYTQYDNWGDPFGIYGSLRQLQALALV
jgi:hypothetical protein